MTEKETISTIKTEKDTETVLDTYTIYIDQNKAEIELERSKSAYDYNYRNDVDKNKEQQELKIQHNTLTKGVLKVKNWLDTKIIRNSKEDWNKVNNEFEKYIVKYTTKNLNSVTITSINDRRTSETTMVTNNDNRESNFSNEEKVNTKQ